MDLTYAVADLHGSDDLLDLAVTAITRHAAAAPAGARTAVFLGDYIDRGAGSRAVVERLMAGPPPDWRWLCLKGNHEDMMLQVLRDPAQVDWWLDNGGGATLLSYGHPARGLIRLDVVPPPHIAWIEALQTVVADRHRVFVHAGVDPDLPLHAQDEQHLLWSRDGNPAGHEGRFVVHGHTPHPNGPVTDGLSIDLDTLAWRTGRLVVGVFDDDQPGGPVAFIPVTR